MKRLFQGFAFALAFAALLIISDLETIKPHAQSTQPLEYIIPLIDTSNGIDTGVSLVDVGHSAIVFMRYVTTGGIISTVGIGSKAVGVAAQETHAFNHRAAWIFNASEHVKNFRGSLHIESTGPLAGTAIIYGKGFQFAYPLQRVD